MAEATMTTVDALLKEVYLNRLFGQLNDECVGRKRIEKTSDGVVTTVGGKYVDFPIRVSRNTGISWRREAELIGAAGTQGYAEVHVPLQYGYGRARITGQVMELAETNVQAFASGLDEEMERLKDDIAKDENRITYGDGSGLLATVTADGANTVTVDNIQYLEIGERIDILTKSNGAVIAAARLISAINESTNVVTYSGANVTATATTDGLYREGNFLTATKREPSGFGNIIDDTSILHGLDPASQPKWKAIVRANPAAAGTPRALSEGIMIELCDAIRTKSGKKTTAIFNAFGVRRSYFNLLVQQRRYTDTKEYAGGFQGLPFNYGTEIPVVEDSDSPPGQMLFVHEPSIRIFRNKDWHWADKDGSIFKWVHDYDIWEAMIKVYYEFGTTQRNAHGKLTDIIES